MAGILRDLGRPARVEMLTDPHVGGIDQAIGAVPDVMRRYALFDIFVLVLDRDGDAGRAERIRSLGERVAHIPRTLVPCLAEQEVEAWLLAAQWDACHREHPRWHWAAVRAEPHVKERYFAPFFAQRRDTRLPGQGRSRLMEGLNLPALMDKCPEVGALRDALDRAVALVSGRAVPPASGPSTAGPQPGGPGRGRSGEGPGGTDGFRRD